MGKKVKKDEKPQTYPLPVPMKVGDEVWVRAKVAEVPTPNTLGWANGMVKCTAVTHGLNQDPGRPQVICTDIKNIMKALA